MKSDAGCFICRKHAGEEAAPPGGYLYADDHFLVCHAPAVLAVAGTLLVESRRHFLDFAEMTPDESAGHGPLLTRLHAAIKRVVGAERMYRFVTLEGTAHFHAWLVPHAPQGRSRGVAFLAEDRQCTEEEALSAANAVRAELA